MEKVRIKTWEEMEKEFGLDSFKNINCLFKFTQSMEKSLPEDRIISVNLNEDNDYIWIKTGWWISSDMIAEYLYFKEKLIW